ASGEAAAAVCGGADAAAKPLELRDSPATAGSGSPDGGTPADGEPGSCRAGVAGGNSTHQFSVARAVVRTAAPAAGAVGPSSRITKIMPASDAGPFWDRHRSFFVGHRKTSVRYFACNNLFA